jgi:hypothetical protein
LKPLNGGERGFRTYSSNMYSLNILTNGLNSCSPNYSPLFFRFVYNATCKVINCCTSKLLLPSFFINLFGLMFPLKTLPLLLIAYRILRDEVPYTPDPNKPEITMGKKNKTRRTTQKELRLLKDTFI